MSTTDRSQQVPTLADVARHAGVSTATVSRCLNSPDVVVAPTRERVMTAVRELGYSPNFNAQSLAAKRTNTVGAVIPTMENSIFAQGLQAFQEELQRHGITLLVSSSSYQEDLEAEQIRALIARGADALLLIGHHRAQDVFDFLDKRSVPALVSWAFTPDAERVCIGFNNAEAMRGLAQLVIGKGHRRIGFISADMASNDRARERLRGVKDAMADAGIDPENLTLVETSYGFETGGDAFRAIMSAETPPTVVMCGNDVLAIGALRAAKEMGLRTPTDISITGFDDIELAMLAEPALTTVHVPHSEMGRRAARMLMKMVQGDEPVSSLELPTDIMVRQTLGPPRQQD